MTIFILGIVGLIFMIALIYFFPSPTYSFEKLYAKVPEEQRLSFKTFRLENNLRHTTVNGIVWRYLTTGAGSKTIVFLHGMGGGYDIWWQQINCFKTGYRVISMTYPPAQNLADLSTGISAILDEERIDKTHIVGSSLGGYFAQYLVKHFPDRIDKAVFANTLPTISFQQKPANYPKFFLGCQSGSSCATSGRPQQKPFIRHQVIPSWWVLT